MLRLLLLLLLLHLLLQGLHALDHVVDVGVLVAHGGHQLFTQGFLGFQDLLVLRDGLLGLLQVHLRLLHVLGLDDFLALLRAQVLVAQLLFGGLQGLQVTAWLVAGGFHLVQNQVFQFFALLFQLRVVLDGLLLGLGQGLLKLLHFHLRVAALATLHTHAALALLLLLAHALGHDERAGQRERGSGDQSGEGLGTNLHRISPCE